jgi:hypothetical protein
MRPDPGLAPAIGASGAREPQPPVAAQRGERRQGRAAYNGGFPVQRPLHTPTAATVATPTSQCQQAGAPAGRARSNVWHRSPRVARRRVAGCGACLMGQIERRLQAAPSHGAETLATRAAPKRAQIRAHAHPGACRARRTHQRPALGAAAAAAAAARGGGWREGSLKMASSSASNLGTRLAPPNKTTCHPHAGQSPLFRTHTYTLALNPEP